MKQASSVEVIIPGGVGLGDGDSADILVTVPNASMANVRKTSSFFIEYSNDNYGEFGTS